MARGDFLRGLQRFLRLHGHLFKSQHLHPLKRYVLEAKRRNGKGLDTSSSPRSQPPLVTNFFPYLAPAAAVIAGTPTLTLICFGLASSRFGISSVSRPF